MTDREKIIDVLRDNIEYEVSTYPDDNYTEVVIKYEALADALIEAGIGDVSKYKNHRIIISNPVCKDICQEGLRLPPEFDLKQFYGAEEVEQIVKERDEWKKRAKTAERNDKLKEKALNNTCAMLYAQGVESPFSDEGWHLRQAEKEIEGEQE